MELVTVIELARKLVIMSFCVIRDFAFIKSADKILVLKDLFGASNDPLFPILDIHQYIGMMEVPRIVLVLGGYVIGALPIKNRSFMAREFVVV